MPLGPNESLSQFDDENSVIESSAANRKRESKAATKSSGAQSDISRSSLGRFEPKYKVGDKTASGAIIKEVNEEEWKLVSKDKKGNKSYQCLKCSKQPIRGDHRSVHGCK